MKDLLKNLDLARIVADLTGDGYLQIKDHRYLASFFSKHLEEIKSFQKRFENLFGVKGRIYIDDRTSEKCVNSGRRYKIFFASKSTILFLEKVGVPVGNKTNVPFMIPKWIYLGSDEIKGAYLRGLFDNEASIYCTRGKKTRWRICFKMAKNKEIKETGFQFFEQIRSLLLDFGIKSSPIRSYKLNIRKDKSESVEMKFDIEESSFRNFFKWVGFEHPTKKDKLLSCVGGQVRLRQSPAEGRVEGSNS